MPNNSERKDTTFSKNFYILLGVPPTGSPPSGVRFAPCFAPLRALQAAHAKKMKSEK